MVKRALILSLLLTCASYGAVYQIDIVKERRERPSAEKFVLYRVKKGDTLLKIMKKHKIPRHLLYEVAKLNNLKNPDLIYAGQIIKLPVGNQFVKTERPKEKTAETDFKLLKTLGAKVKREGYLFTASGKVNLKKTPMVQVGQKRFIVDFSNQIDRRIRKELADAGFTVVDEKGFESLIEEVLSQNFTSIQKKGKLILGVKDILVYNYDYMGYNRYTGQRVVINRAPDTPPPLVSLLNAYGIGVIQPPRVEPKTKEGNGTLRIIKGDGITKINSLVKLLTGKSGVKTEYGIRFPELKLHVVYDFITPEEKVKLELSGDRVVVLTGNFLYDVENILTLVPLANKMVELILYEPPESKGKRSKFTVKGLLVSTPKKDWFLIDSVDRPEEIPYLLYRGVNLIIY